jgi:hypothetical protein
VAKLEYNNVIWKIKQVQLKFKGKRRLVDKSCPGRVQNNRWNNYNNANKFTDKIRLSRKTEQHIKRTSVNDNN